MLVDAEDLPAHLDDRLAVLMLTHVNYRTGRMHRMAEVTRAAHAAGAVVIWDLAHSAGAVPVDLHGGGGRERRRRLRGRLRLQVPERRPGRAGLRVGASAAHRVDGSPRLAPAAVGLAGPRRAVRVHAGLPAGLRHRALRLRHAADAVDWRRSNAASTPCWRPKRYGGLDALRRKSLALTDLFIELVESRCAGQDLTLVTPRDGAERGSQVSFAHDTGGYAIMQALIARGVIGDFRAPDILRFGFTPLYTRFVDVWDAVDRFQQVLASGEWRDPRFAVRAAVT